MELRKKLLSVAALAFAAALSAGVAVSAGAEQTLDGFKIDATAVRISDETRLDGETERNTSGLRFHTVTPEGETEYTNPYTVLTVVGIEGEKKVNTELWRKPTADDNTNGWNTVLMDIPAAYYTAEVTAQSFVEYNGVVYQTGVAKTSIAQTASWAMNLGNTDEKLVAYTTGAVESITLSQASATAFVGDAAIQLTAETQPAGYGVVWASSNADVATVDNTGKVTIVGKGAANITASMGGKVATFALTVYEKYEISSAEDFKNKLMSDEARTSNLTAYDYYELTQDIDFAGIIVNHTEGYRTVGWDGTLKYGTETNSNNINETDGNYSRFSGIIDGKGYMLKNLTIAPNTGNNSTTIGWACLFGLFDGTMKNLGADVTVNVGGVNAARGAALVGIANNNATFSNCYVSLLSPYYSSNNHPVAPLISIASPQASTDVMTIENCVGVLQDITYNTGNEYYASGLIGRVALGAEGRATLEIKNSYAVEIDYTGSKDAAVPEFYATATKWNAPTTVVNTNAYATLAELYLAAKTGMTEANGWNNLWTAENGTLKFGDETLFECTEISTAAEFMAMPLDANAYCLLTQDIDFDGIIINHTEGYRTIGWDGTGSGVPGTNYATFYGTFDGNGYTLKNVTVAPNTGNFDTGVGFACVFGVIENATIKNVAVDMKVNVGGVNAARGASFIGCAYSACTISNCYVNLSCDYYSSGNYPVAPLVSYVVSNAGTPFVVENCVGVLQDITYNRSSGPATGLVGRLERANTFEIRNSYAVEIGYDGGANATTPELFSSEWKAPTTLTNSTAYGTVADMFTAATTGMTAANGWNSFWTVDAENNTLKFGNTVVYQPQA